MKQTILKNKPVNMSDLNRRSFWIMPFLTALIINTFLLSEIYGMTLNLAMPYGDRCSPPQNPFLTFYSSQSEDMMFDGQREIIITVQAGLRSSGLSYSLHRNMVEKPFITGEVIALRYGLKRGG